MAVAGRCAGGGGRILWRMQVLTTAHASAHHGGGRILWRFCFCLETSANLKLSNSSRNKRAESHERVGGRQGRSPGSSRGIRIPPCMQPQHGPPLCRVSDGPSGRLVARDSSLRVRHPPLAPPPGPPPGRRTNLCLRGLRGLPQQTRPQDHSQSQLLPQQTRPQVHSQSRPPIAAPTTTVCVGSPPPSPVECERWRSRRRPRRSQRGE